MAINDLLPVNINGTQQWILVRGKNPNAPLLIHVQAGPGLPMIPEADAMQRNLHLEDDFLVVYWDQRGCGKSFSNDLDAGTISFTQLESDLAECTKFVLTRYNKRSATVVGYSIGATITLMAAAHYPSLFNQIFLTGIDIDLPRATEHINGFLEANSKQARNKRMAKEISTFINVPIVESKHFQQRAKLLTNLNAIMRGMSYNKLLFNTIKNMLMSKAYKFSDIPRAIQGMEFSQNALLPELNTLNLFNKIQHIKIPVHFAQGKWDVVAPLSICQEFYQHLQKVEMTLTVFHNSAHMPHYEEPAKFADLIKTNALLN